MLEIKSKKSQDELAARAIKRRFWLIVIGVTILFSGYNCVLALQSSMHVENGLGSMLTTLSYGTQITLSFFVIPFILRLIGAKKSLILAEVAYIIYVVVNAFKVDALLVVGALAAGFAEGLFWLPIGISFIYFAKKYRPYSTKSTEKCVMEFSGIFFFVFQFNPIIGNLMGTILLNYVGSNNSNSTMSVFENQTNATFTIGYNSAPPKTEPFTVNYTQASDWPDFNHVDYCGVNDCQDVTVIKDSIDNYVPTNKVAIYALTGFFVLLMILGIISHVILVPEMPFSDFNQPIKSKKSVLKNDGNEISLQNKSLKNIFLLSLEATKDTFQQFFDPYQLFFVTPYTTYLGINLGFVLSEATRAYAACLLGIKQVGICVAIFAMAASIHCFMIGRFYGKRGRVPLLVFQLIYDLSLYSFLLLWTPTEETAWVTYGIFALFGIYNANSQMLVSNIFGCDFYKSKEISFNIWCIVFAIGFSLQYGVSTMLCVREKIYICMGWVAIGVTLQIIFEKFLKDEATKNDEEEEENEEEEKIDLKV